VADFHFVHPGDLATRTGGYRYARCLLEVLRARGLEVAVHRLADSFPFPDADALAAADRVLAGIAADSIVVVDGLALGAMPLEAARHARRLRLVALVHHPLALETGLAPAAAARLEAAEREALRSTRAVVVTSPSTRLAMQDYGVAGSRVTVVLPGTGSTAQGRLREASSGERSPVRLLCVASVTPRKGQLELVEALAAYRARDPAAAWSLTCIGSLDRDPAYAAAVQARVRALGLEARVAMVGERDEDAVDRAYDAADLFVLASHHEGYGMVLAEALAHGLPVVSTTAGAIPQTVPADAALLVAPGDVGQLADALGQAIARPRVRQAMADAARRAARSLPDWPTAADRFQRVLAAVRQAPEPAADGSGAGGTGDVGGTGQAFEASWLALREPYDHAARDAALTRRLADFLRPRAARDAATQLRILDLGCGTGSTLRYLAPRLGGAQSWTLVDNDVRLLAALPQAGAVAADGAGGLRLDLAPLTLDLAAAVERLPVADVDLIAASALLDLVSPAWLDRLLRHVQRSRAQPPALLMVLTYDGTLSWQPPHADDAWATDLFNRHQRGDKGFGPALGPAAADETTRRLQAAGYSITAATSPWHLGADDVAIQQAFLAGMAGAVAELAAAAEAPRLQAWLRSRQAWLAEGISSIEVGHRDLLALPGDPGRA
jgi:glycosyltransferase involved in cell wall biosynthesis/SAM-dependent methyltransferase